MYFPIPIPVLLEAEIQLRSYLRGGLDLTTAIMQVRQELGISTDSVATLLAADDWEEVEVLV